MMAWFLVPTVIILAVVALFTFSTYQRVTQNLVLERNGELTRLLADQLGLDLHEYGQQLHSLAATHSLAEADPITQQTALRLYSDRLTDFDAGVLVIGPHGTVSAANWQRLELVGADWSEAPFFEQLRSASGPSPDTLFSNVGPYGPQEHQAVAVAIPMCDGQGTFQGTLVGLFHLGSGSDTRSSALQRQIFRRVQPIEGGQTYLVDGQGQLIYHTDTWRIGEFVVGQAAVQRVLNGAAGGIRTQNAEGERIVASFAPVPGTSWGLVLEESWVSLIRPTRPYQRFLLGLLALGLLVPALVIAWGAGRITQPISELTDAAQEVAGGNFGQVIDVHTGDELEALAAQFNRMSSDLEASYANLEQRVADRTRELETLNTLIATVSRSLNLEAILHDALDQTLELMGMDTGVAYRLEEDDTLVPMASKGLSAAFVDYIDHLPLWTSAAGRAVRLERPVVMPVAQYPQGELKTLMKREGLRMAVSVPLTAKGRVLGAINLGSRTVINLTAEQLSLLAAVGQQTGVAVENARLYERAEESAVAAERNRLARDLHDAVTQTLFSASIIADVLPRIWDRNPEEGLRRLEELRQLTRGALAEMRTLLVELRPTALIEAELGELLRQLGEAVTGRARIPVTTTVEGTCDFPPDVKVAVYRIAQEALNNVVKHAGASQIEVSLRCHSGGAVLSVRDDGRGFDPGAVTSDHLGLGIMAERAEAVGATFSIDTEPERGTEVRVEWSV
jgi:nitrate/nitrite-specific signal transduction histidine kinase